jgi:hypothetical protein
LKINAPRDLHTDKEVVVKEVVSSLVGSGGGVSELAQQPENMRTGTKVSEKNTNVGLCVGTSSGVEVDE